MSFLNAVAAPILFPSILWRTTSQAIHITFDDGPHPAATPHVLDILKKRNILATFFLLGRNVERYPEVAREIVESGHTIGSHGHTHTSMLFRSSTFQMNEIRAADAAIGEILGQKAEFFRPPYGHFDMRTLRLAKAEGHKVVMWDVDARDFRQPESSRILNSVSKQARQGSIILLHDNENTAHTVGQYLDPLLERLSSDGFKFSALTL
ncbi:MAG: polysaccharide deacetylase family protein [Ignavibacteriales bacterium]|nr:polysaccharide deacetylase family protein [Ignavibacteriales bacterium]